MLTVQRNGLLVSHLCRNMNLLCTTPPSKPQHSSHQNIGNSQASKPRLNDEILDYGHVRTFNKVWECP